jgi:two-component system sensor histidine kinase VicK
LHKEKTDIIELISTTIQDVKINLGVKKEKEVFKKNNNFYKKHKTIDIKLSSDEEHDNIYHPLYVMVDRSRITQVISNILSNSIKSIDNYDGNITISISKRNKEKNNISQADEILVNIKDTGKGINPEIHSKLFEKFSTNSSSGIGLGLYITKNIIEAHDGSIWAENNPDGRGATFSFSLPSM